MCVASEFQPYGFGGPRMRVLSRTSRITPTPTAECSTHTGHLTRYGSALGAAPALVSVAPSGHTFSPRFISGTAVCALPAIPFSNTRSESSSWRRRNAAALVDAGLVRTQCPAAARHSLVCRSMPPSVAIMKSIHSANCKERVWSGSITRNKVRKSFWLIGTLYRRRAV